MVSEFSFHARHIMRDCDDYLCVLDELRRPSDRPSGFDQLLVAHIDFHKFTKASLASLKREWDVFRSITDAPLFAYCADDETQPDKWERFVRLLGFEEVHNAVLPAHDGCLRRIFVSHKVSNASINDQTNFQHHVTVGRAGPVPDAGVSECSGHLQ